MAKPQDREEGALRCTVDRFERTATGEDLAVLVFDNGQQLVVPAALLPEGVHTGTVLRVAFATDQLETETRRERIKSLQDELFTD